MYRSKKHRACTEQEFSKSQQMETVSIRYLSGEDRLCCYNKHAFKSQQFTKQKCISCSCKVCYILFFTFSQGIWNIWFPRLSGIRGKRERRHPALQFVIISFLMIQDKRSQWRRLGVKISNFRPKKMQYCQDQAKLGLTHS